MRDGEPMTWAGLVDPAGLACVTVAGAETVRWAVGVHERFFGDDWLQRAASKSFGRVPFMAVGLWPVSSPGAVLRLIERACQLSLAKREWENLRDQVRQNRPGEAATHLRLVLETVGWGLRAGMPYELEPDVGAGKRPDVLLDDGNGARVLVEVTSQGRDQARRLAESYGWLVDQLIWAVEREHGVVVTARSESALCATDARSWFTEVAAAAPRVAAGSAKQQVWRAGNIATVHPPGTPVTVIHDGPPLAGDAWPRLAARLGEKALQTRGGPPAWIRVEVDPSLYEFTTLATLTPEARLGVLVGNVAAVLKDSKHVLGVMLGPSPRPGPAGDRRLLPAGGPATTRTGTVLPASTVRQKTMASGPTVVKCGLPGGWARSTVVVPNPSCHRDDPLRPGLVLASEGSWLDWALRRLAMPALDRLVP